MSEQNKAIVHKLVEVINTHDLSVFEALATPEVVQQIRDTFAWVNTVWPGVQTLLTDMVAEGELVWCRVSTNGTHTGEWEGIPPTGKRWTNPGVIFVRIQGGKIVSLEWLFDALNHIKQLGGRVAH